MKTPFSKPLPDGEIERECFECRGDGTVECEKCHGDGTHECDCGDEHDCRECDGEGTWLCEKCFGSGCEVTGPRVVADALGPSFSADVRAALVKVAPRLDAAGLPVWTPRLSGDRVDLLCIVECLDADRETQDALSAVGFTRRTRPRGWSDGRDRYVQMVRDPDVVALRERLAARGAA